MIKHIIIINITASKKKQRQSHRDNQSKRKTQTFNFSFETFPFFCKNVAKGLTKLSIAWKLPVCAAVWASCDNCTQILHIYHRFRTSEIFETLRKTKSKRHKLRMICESGLRAKRFNFTLKSQHRSSLTLCMERSRPYSIIKGNSKTPFEQYSPSTGRKCLY